MRVAFVSQPFNRVRPHVQGGSIPIWIDQVARRLAHSCDVSVFSPRWREDPGIEICENVEYCGLRTGIDRRLSQWVQPVFRFRGASFPEYASISHYALYASRIAAAVRRRKHDVIHIMNFPQFARIIHVLNPHAKIVIHMHCKWLNEFAYRAMARCLKASDSVIGCSSFIAQAIRRRFPWFKGEIAPILNGVDTDVFTSPTDSWSRHSHTILYVGRISPEKGIHVLLDTFARVCERHPTSKLELVGPIGAAPREFIVDLSDDPKVKELTRFYDGHDYFEHLKEFLPERLADRVSFVGPIPYTQLVRRYSTATIFVFPSVCDEAFGMPIVEAMACGKPVVATRAGGIPELVVDGVTGLLVDRGDPDQLVGAILELLGDEPKRRAMGAAGRERAVQLFSWDRIADNVLKHYATLSPC